MGDDATDRTVEQRLDDLAATVEAQQATIERLRGRLDGAESTETVGQGDDSPDGQAGASGGLSGRQGALAAAGTVGLLGLGAGSASAAPRGQIGTPATPLRRLYLAGLAGDVTGGDTVTTLPGDGLAVDTGTDALQVDLDAIAGTGLSVSGGKLVAATDAYVGASAYYSGGQTWAVGERKTVAFDTELFDAGDNFDTSTYTFTAPADGFYDISTKVKFLTDYDLSIVVDRGGGGTDVAVSSYGMDYLGNALGKTLSLSAGDRVSVDVERTDSFEGDTNAPVTGEAATYLTVDRIG